MQFSCELKPRSGDANHHRKCRTCCGCSATGQRTTRRVRLDILEARKISETRILANLGSLPSHYGRNESAAERLFVFRVLEISSATSGLGSGPLACNSAASDFRDRWPTTCLMGFCMRIAFKNVNRNRRSKVGAAFVNARGNFQAL